MSWSIQAESCDDVTELLPWLLNGSLEAGEREALLEHLKACEECAAELEDTLAWLTLDPHIPSWSLAEYAQGLVPSGLDRDRLERHLALCPTCSEELALATSDRVLDLGAQAADSTEVSDGTGPRELWRPLAIAASIALILTSGAAFFGSRSGSLDQRVGEQVAAAEVANVEASCLFADGFEAGSVARWSIATTGEEATSISN